MAEPAWRQRPPSTYGGTGYEREWHSHLSDAHAHHIKEEVCECFPAATEEQVARVHLLLESKTDGRASKAFCVDNDNQAIVPPAALGRVLQAPRNTARAVLDGTYNEVAWLQQGSGSVARSLARPSSPLPGAAALAAPASHPAAGALAAPSGGAAPRQHSSSPVAALRAAAKGTSPLPGLIPAAAAAGSTAPIGTNLTAAFAAAASGAGGRGPPRASLSPGAAGSTGSSTSLFGALNGTQFGAAAAAAATAGRASPGGANSSRSRSRIGMQQQQQPPSGSFVPASAAAPGSTGAAGALGVAAMLPLQHNSNPLSHQQGLIPAAAAAAGSTAAFGTNLSAPPRASLNPGLVGSAGSSMNLFGAVDGAQFAAAAATGGHASPGGANSSRSRPLIDTQLPASNSGHMRPGGSTQQQQQQPPSGRFLPGSPAGQGNAGAAGALGAAAMLPLQHYSSRSLSHGHHQAGAPPPAGQQLSNAVPEFNGDEAALGGLAVDGGGGMNAATAAQLAELRQQLFDLQQQLEQQGQARAAELAAARQQHEAAEAQKAGLQQQLVLTQAQVNAAGAFIARLQQELQAQAQASAAELATAKQRQQEAKQQLAGLQQATQQDQRIPGLALRLADAVVGDLRGQLQEARGQIRDLRAQLQAAFQAATSMLPLQPLPAAAQARVVTTEGPGSQPLPQQPLDAPAAAAPPARVAHPWALVAANPLAPPPPPPLQQQQQPAGGPAEQQAPRQQGGRQKRARDPAAAAAAAADAAEEPPARRAQAGGGGGGGVQHPAGQQQQQQQQGDVEAVVVVGAPVEGHQQQQHMQAAAQAPAADQAAAAGAAAAGAPTGLAASPVPRARARKPPTPTRAR